MYICKMYKYVLFLFLIASSCHYNPSNECKEVFIDIRTGSISNSYQKDSIFDKQVFITNDTAFPGFPGQVIYFVTIHYYGNDSLISFFGGFSEEINFNKAKYHWTSDSSINMTLFNTNNDSSIAIFLKGSMDGKSGQNGYLD